MISKRYLAQLSMTVAKARPKMKITTGLNDVESAIKAVAYHALNILVNDIRESVQKLVEVATKRYVDDVDETISTHARARRTALKSWLKDKNPLSNEPNGQLGGNYAMLSIMLCSDPNSEDPLLALSKKPLTYEGLLEILNVFAMTLNQRRPAPLTKTGGFQYVLPIAYQMIRQLIPAGNNKKECWSHTLIHMMKEMKIHFIPWHKESPNAYAIDFEIWTSLRPIKSIPHSATKTFEGRVQEAAATVIRLDPYAPWDLPDRLSNMKELWKKTVLPLCWNIQYASLSGKADYLTEMYRYVAQHYDGSHWTHHLALIVAICFSRVVPNICFDNAASISATDSPGITEEIRQMDWVPAQSSSHKGTVAPLPFIVMMSTALIGFWDKESPLNKHLVTNRGAMGKAWTDKHGMYINIYFTFIQW